MSEMVPAIVIGAFIQFAYVEIWGVNAAHVSIIWTLFNVFKFFVIPSAGTIVDQSNNKIKLYLITTAISLVGFWIVWNPILFANPAFILAQMFLGLVLFAIGSTIQLIARSCMFSELFDPQSRSAVAGIQQLFSVAAIVAGVISPPIVSDGWLCTRYMASIMVLLTIVGAVCCAIGCSSRNKGKTEQKVTEPVKSQQESFLKRTWVSLKQSPELSLLFIAVLASNIGFASTLSSGQLYIKYFVPGVKGTRDILGFALTSDAQIGLAQLSGQIVTMFSTPLWLKLCARIGYGSSWALSGSAYGLSLILQYLFQNGSLEFLFFCQILGALTIPAVCVIPGLALADIVDTVKLKTGQNVAGHFQGIISMSIILASVLQGLISTAVFGASDYNPALDVQSESALSAINNIAVFIPAVAFMISGASMVAYKSSSSKIKTE